MPPDAVTYVKGLEARTSILETRGRRWARYSAGGNANGHTPAANWSWALAESSADWAQFGSLTIQSVANDTLLLAPAGVYRISAGVRVASCGTGGYGQVELTVNGTSRSAAIAAGNGLNNASARVGITSRLAAGSAVRVVFTARSSGETAYDVVADPPWSELEVEFLG